MKREFCWPIALGRAKLALPATMETVSLLDLPHAEVRALLATGAPVYLPVNPVEYHGPHLSLHNDHLASVALGRDLHARLASDRGWPFVLAASIEAGVEPCPGPGTRATPYLVLRGLVERACAALADLGAKRVILMTFHGAPLHSLALEAGVRVLEHRGVRALQPLNLLMQVLRNVDATLFEDALGCIESPDDRALLLSELPRDFHAGFFETSVALHYVPETVSDVFRTLPPCPDFGPSPALDQLSRLARKAGKAELADELRLAAHGVAWYALRPFPGYTGRPHLAKKEAGAAFARLIVERYAECAERVFAGEPPPRPIMRWLPRFTLNGRIPGPSVPLSDVAQFNT